MTRRGGTGRRPLLAVLAAAFAALAVAAAVLLVDTDTSLAVGENVFANAGGIIDANNSPSLARNPRDPANVVVSHRQDQPGFSAALEVSFDGGRAYQTTVLPLPAGLDRPFAPDAAFAPDGTLYVSYVNLQGNGNRPDNLWVARSSDGGRTLADPVRVAGALSFQARIVVGRTGAVHLTWLKVGDVAPYAIVGYPSPIVAATSTDGGRTFSEPVQVSDADRMRVAAASPVVDAAGNLVVLYEDFGNDSRDFLNLDGPVWDGTFTLVVSVSKDGGKTFGKGVEVDAGVVPTKRFLVFLPEFPALAAGPGRTLYAAWADGRNGDLDVLVRRSDDGGATWEPPVRANTNPLKDGTDQYMPRLSVAPDGRLDVLFLDRRRDPRNILTDAELAISRNRGKSFENIRVSSAPFDSRVGFIANSKLEADFGSRLGLASTKTAALAVWTDTRLGVVDTARQDIAAAPVTVSTTTTSKAVRWPAAFGLACLAFLCLGAWWTSGRGRMAGDGVETEEDDG
ncbi:MAG TPA: sialidase family protein [Acidimicrobiales bacterium]|nr:sialidase family protein [Acidimicrobiales bacterium]